MAENGALSPAQAAVIIGVHSNTIRSWTREYGDVLSDSSRGRPRLLTPRDVALLQLVTHLRAEGLAPDIVLERLRQVPDTAIQQPYIDITAPTVEDSTLPTAPATVDTSIFLREIAALVDTRTSKLDARLRVLESRRDLWLGILIGLFLGLVIACGFILLRLP